VGPLSTKHRAALATKLAAQHRPTLGGSRNGVQQLCEGDKPSDHMHRHDRVYWLMTVTSLCFVQASYD